MIALATHLRLFTRIVIPTPVDDYTTARVLTMDYVAGTKITAVSAVQWTEIDGAALAEELFHAYLHQILIDGFFHADPHPGNVLLTHDHNIALLDLGMVGRLSPSVQEQLFRLMLAISEGRGDDAANVAIALGEKRAARRASWSSISASSPRTSASSGIRPASTSASRIASLESAGRIGSRPAVAAYPSLKIR